MSRRLFLGLMANAATQGAVANYQMNWEWPATARLTSPDKLHLTLFFLGDVTSADERRLRDALRGAAMASALHLRLSKPDTFDPGIAILRPEEDRALAVLHRDLEAVLRDVGRPVDVRPWQPHVTLARDAIGCRPPAMAASIEMQADRFSLVCSRPDAGHSYEIVESWPAATQTSL